MTEELTQTIISAAAYAEKHYGYFLTTPHRYYFVERFYETDFQKITPKAPMGSRVFDLTQILETENLPETAKIAEMLRTKTWG